ncbi:MAG: FliH/SctL family protein [Burkholderiaceae bacterium]
MSESSSSTRRKIMSADEITDLQAFKLPRLGPAGGRRMSDDDRERELAQAREDALAAGHARGLAEGIVRGRAEGEASAIERMHAEREREVAQLGAAFAVRMNDLASAAELEMARIESRLADQLTEMCVVLARKIVQHTIATDPEVINSVVQAGLERVRESAGDLTCRLNPDDLEAVQRALRAQGETVSVRLLPSATIDRGGCVLESADAQLDLTVENRWIHAMAGLGRSEAKERGDA